MEQANCSVGHLHRHLKLLEELEYIVQESGANGLKFTYRLLYEGDGSLEEKLFIGLKPVEDLKDV